MCVCVRVTGVYWEGRGGCQNTLLVSLYAAKSLVPMLLEIVGVGGVLQGDRGELLTPGFPAQNYENGALYQVLPMIDMTSTPALD